MVQVGKGEGGVGGGRHPNTELAYYLLWIIKFTGWFHLMASQRQDVSSRLEGRDGWRNGWMERGRWGEREHRLWNVQLHLACGCTTLMHSASHSRFNGRVQRQSGCTSDCTPASEKKKKEIRTLPHPPPHTPPPTPLRSISLAHVGGETLTPGITPPHTQWHAKVNTHVLVPKGGAGAQVRYICAVAVNARFTRYGSGGGTDQSPAVRWQSGLLIVRNLKCMSWASCYRFIVQGRYMFLARAQIQLFKLPSAQVVIMIFVFFPYSLSNSSVNQSVLISTVLCLQWNSALPPQVQLSNDRRLDLISLITLSLQNSHGKKIK